EVKVIYEEGEYDLAEFEGVENLADMDIQVKVADINSQPKERENNSSETNENNNDEEQTNEQHSSSGSNSLQEIEIEIILDVFTGEKELFTKIKNKEINDKDQLKTAKNTLVEFIGNKDVEKRIDNLRKEVEAARNSDQKNAVREKLKKLKVEDNIYVKKREADIEKLLEKLESNTDDTSGNNKPGIPWGVILPIVAVAIVIIVGVVLVVRKKKQKEIRNLED
ncbi:MAG: hypothetical protein MRERV_50c001, partial [Mycoplasmataceae bacterium RV_VA103A]